MRISILLTCALFVYLLGTTGCEKCWCCGDAIGSVTCVKDSTQLNIYTAADGTIQGVIAATQDTINYYTAKGYTCTQSVGTYGNLRRVCGPLHKQQAEDGGQACEPYSDVCEP